jgi:hypothetical protein
MQCRGCFVFVSLQYPKKPARKQPISFDVANGLSGRHAVSCHVIGWSDHLVTFGGMLQKPQVPRVDSCFLSPLRCLLESDQHTKNSFAKVLLSFLSLSRAISEA